MFKLIPSVVKGSWVIKQAVGNTPVLLGKKLTTRYYRLGLVYAHQPLFNNCSAEPKSMVGMTCL